MNTATYMVMAVVVLVVIGAVIRKCKANNDKVFADAVARTAAVEERSNRELAEYNAKVGECNAKILELHQQNLALVALVRKHCPEDVSQGSV